MEVLYIGASRRAGTSGKTGKLYDMAEVAYLVADEDGSKRDEKGNTVWDYTGYGRRTFNIELDPSKIHEFKELKSPSVLTLVVEPKPNNPSRNWVIGVKS